MWLVSSIVRSSKIDGKIQSLLLLLLLLRTGAGAILEQALLLKALDQCTQGVEVGGGEKAEGLETPPSVRLYQ